MLYDRRLKNHFIVLAICVICINSIVTLKINDEDTFTDFTTTEMTLKYSSSGSLRTVNDSGGFKKKLSFLRCCPKGMVFDIYSKVCINSEFNADYDSILDQNFEIIIRSDFMSYVCPEVQLDYVLSKDDLFYNYENDTVSSESFFNLFLFFFELF